MKATSFLSLLLMGFIFSSCSHEAHTVATAEHDVWFFEARGNESYPIFCMANKTDTSAEPVCYKADRKYIKHKSTTKAVVVEQPQNGNQPISCIPIMPQDENADGNKLDMGLKNSVDPKVGPINGSNKEVREERLAPDKVVK